MLKSNLLYPYGFVLTDKTHENIPTYYNRKSILDTYIYSYDDRETPSYFEMNSFFIIIHGNFVHVGIEQNISNDDLAKYLLTSYISNYDHFLDTLDFIGGRFAIIVGNSENIEVYNDATAMRSVYFSTDQTFIASHYNLVKDNISTEPSKLAKKYGAIDFTYDRSPATNVRAIMPNFKFDLQTKDLVRFYPRVNNKYTSLSVNKRYTIFEKLWKDQIDYYMDKYDDVAFSLTGGNDSRISLAMLKNYKDSIRMFTYAAVQDTGDVENKFEKSYDNDRIILEQMKDNLNLNHEFYFFKDNKFEFSSEELNALSKNVFRSHGRFLVAYYMNSFPSENSLHIRANLLEIGRAFLIDPTTKNNLDAINNSFIPYVMNKTRMKRSNISDLKNYTLTQNQKFYTGDLYDYERLDLAFWETRMGRWHAEIVNETDIAFQSFIPYNMRALIDISLSFPYDIRKSIKFFRDLINRNYPVLNFFGYNNFNNLYEQGSSQNINIHSPYSKFKNSFFYNFSLFNKKNNLIKIINNNKNMIYIDRDNLVTGNYSEVKIPYRTKKGHLNLSLRSPYSSKSAKDTLVYEVYKNDVLILKEDMSSWKFKNNITIFNMLEGDSITLRVNLLKNLNGISWENASKLIVREYTEFSSTKNVDKTITTSSPESILFNI